MQHVDFTQWSNVVARRSVGVLIWGRASLCVPCVQWSGSFGFSVFDVHPEATGPGGWVGTAFSGHHVVRPGLRGTWDAAPPVSLLWALPLWPWVPCGVAHETPGLRAAPGPHRPHPLSWTASSTASSPSLPTPATPGHRRTEWPTRTWPAGSWLWPTPSCCSGMGASGYPTHPNPGRPSGGSSRPACTPVLIEERDLRNAGQ